MYYSRNEMDNIVRMQIAVYIAVRFAPAGGGGAT